MARKIKILLVGFLLIALSVFALFSKSLLGDEASLPFWSFDGIAAICGGVYIAWWSARVLRESEEDDVDIDNQGWPSQRGRRRGHTARSLIRRPKRPVTIGSATQEGMR